MDRDFVEKCRLLKQHFTKLTQTDTETGQSIEETSSPDVAVDIINEAKKLLFYEQLDALSDQDIERIRQNSVVKYAKTLENYVPKASVRKSLCQKNKIHWNNDLFQTPKRNFRFGNSKLHTILENQENKENDEICNTYPENWDKIEINMEDDLEEMKNTFEDRNMKQQFSNKEEKIEHTKEESQKMYNDINVEDDFEDMLKQYEEYFEIPMKVTDKYYKQSKKETMKNDCEKYYNIRTKIDDEIEAMRKECADMEAVMRTMKEKEKIKIVKDCKKVEKEVRFLQEPIDNITDKKDNICIKEKQRNKVKLDEFKNIPELKITPQSKANIVELLEIKKLQIEKSDNQTFDTPIINNDVILKSTLMKWRNFVRENKTSRVKTKSNNKKIENFLENIQKFKLSNSQKSKSDLHSSDKEKNDTISVKTKPKSSSSLETKVSSFEHRFKAQKDIIAMQKAKLAEQNKLIEELKLTKIQKEARQSLEKAQSELQKTAKLSSKYKYRAKPEPKAVIEEVVEDPIGVAFSLNLSKAPKLVQMMEERAKEREEKRILIKERKRIIEEEKKRLVEEQIQRKMQEESEEKQQRIEKMKRQRELTRQLEIRRQLEKKRFITINQLAHEHYKRKLMKNYGMKHFRMLVYNVKINLEIGKRFYEHNIVIRCYRSWKMYAKGIIAEKTNRADNLYEYKMKRKLMKSWKKIHYKLVQCKQVAIDRYEMSLQNKVFVYWHRLVCEYHIQYRINVKKAEKHYKRDKIQELFRILATKCPDYIEIDKILVNHIVLCQPTLYFRVLLFQCLHNWRSLPDIMRIERIQNERKRKWRLRVAEILSDYDPLKCYD